MIDWGDKFIDTKHSEADTKQTFCCDELHVRTLPNMGILISVTIVVAIREVPIEKTLAI